MLTCTRKYTENYVLRLKTRGGVCRKVFNLMTNHQQCDFSENECTNLVLRVRWSSVWFGEKMSSDGQTSALPSILYGPFSSTSDPM